MPKRWVALGLSAFLLSSSCTAVFGGTALLTRGYPDRKTETFPVEPFEESLAGLSFDPASLQFQCITFRKASAERVVTTTRHYGPTWKLIALLLGGMEAVGTGLPIAIVEGSGGDLPRAGRIALGIFFLDGVLLMAGAMVPERRTVEEELRDAPLEELAYCPQGMALSMRGGFFPIDSSGYTTPEGTTQLLGAMSTPGESFVVSTPGRDIEINPTPEERCAWALARQSPEASALCPQRPGLAVAPGLAEAFARKAAGGPVKIIIRFDRK